MLDLEPQPELALGNGTTHASRSLMLEELNHLFAVVPEGSALELYHRAVLDENALLKPTVSARAKSLKYLRQLYSLDEGYVLFAPLRRLWTLDPTARPTLAVLTAVVRDGLLRSTAHNVAELSIGELLDAKRVPAMVSAGYSGALSPATLAAITQRVANSWTQSGHLKRVGAKRVRQQVRATPAAVAYALLIGYLLGHRGVLLFETIFMRLLDAQPAELDSLAFAAAQRGWLEYRRIGDVAEVGFAGLLLPLTGDFANGRLNFARAAVQPQLEQRLEHHVSS